MNLASFFGVLHKPGRTIFKSGLSQSQVDGLKTLLVATEGLPVTHRAYMLATTYHETAGTMQPIVERGARAYFAKYEAGTPIGRRLGNILPGEGYLYRGRGYVQLTGRDNYIRAGAELGVLLAQSPDIALLPDIAARILRHGMQEGWFTGKTLSDYLPGDYVNARRIINGKDKATLIAGHARAFEVALS